MKTIILVKSVLFHIESIISSHYWPVWSNTNSVDHHLYVLYIKLGQPFEFKNLTCSFQNRTNLVNFVHTRKVE